MSEVIQKAVDNLNAAFELNVRLPISEPDLLTLADLAERRGREDVAVCLREALRFEAGVATQLASHRNISTDRRALGNR